MPEIQMTYSFFMSCYLAPEKNGLDMHIRNNQKNLPHKNDYILPCYLYLFFWNYLLLACEKVRF